MHDNEARISSPESPRPRLLDAVREAIRRRHYSYRTEEACTHWGKRFTIFSGKRHPRELGAREVTAFLNYLARERGVAAATQNQALAALLFLYKEVLAEPLPWLDGSTTPNAPSGVLRFLPRRKRGRCWHSFVERNRSGREVRNPLENE